VKLQGLVAIPLSIVLVAGVSVKLLAVTNVAQNLKIFGAEQCHVIEVIPAQV
jgi:hypothetical protein